MMNNENISLRIQLALAVAVAAGAVVEVAGAVVEVVGAVAAAAGTVVVVAGIVAVEGGIVVAGAAVVGVAAMVVEAAGVAATVVAVGMAGVLAMVAAAMVFGVAETDTIDSRFHWLNQSLHMSLYLLFRLEHWQSQSCVAEPHLASSALSVSTFSSGIIPSQTDAQYLTLFRPPIKIVLAAQMLFPTRCPPISLPLSKLCNCEKVVFTEAYQYRV